MRTKIFKFKKGEIDYKTWTKVTKFIMDYFSIKRILPFHAIKLKTNYEIMITIKKASHKTDEN